MPSISKLLNPLAWFGTEPPRDDVFCLGGVPITEHEMYSHLLFLGAAGAGKTSLARMLRRWLFKRGCGAVILGGKVTDADEAIEDAARAGRLECVRVIEAGGRYRMNLLSHLLTRQGGGPESAEQFVSLLTHVGEDPQERRGGEEFWEAGKRERSLKTFAALQLGLPRATFVDAYEFLTGKPSSIRRSKAGMYGETFAVVMDSLLKNGTQESADLIDYWFKKAPLVPSKTAQGFDQGALNIWSLLTTKLMRSLYCAPDANFCPELAVRDGNIVVFRHPVLRDGRAGCVAQAAGAVAMQQARLRIKGSEAPPLLVFADDAQLTATSLDPMIAQLGRASMCIRLSVFQDLETASVAFGKGDIGKQVALSYLNQFATKIATQTSSRDTAEWLSGMIGNHRAVMCGGGGGFDPRQRPASMLDAALGSMPMNGNWHEQITPLFPAERFFTLQRGGRPAFKIGAVILKGGGYPDGSRFKNVLIDQEL
ncbi:MAG: hypothetical protein U0746_02830 [Gemmataceae bacterium]